MDVNNIKEPKSYVSVSTRLSEVDASLFQNYCKKIGISPSERIRQLVLLDIKKPQKYILAGKNRIRYNKTDNSFSWFVELDSGQEIEVLKNLSLEFLKNLNQEIQEAIKERNLWIHQTQPDSVDVPGELATSEPSGERGGGE